MVEPHSEDVVDVLLRRYAEDPLKHRLLLRLYGAHAGHTVPDLAESFRVHPSSVRRSIQALVSDGLVAQSGTGRGAVYSLLASPSSRSRVTELLRRTIGNPGAR